MPWPALTWRPKRCACSAAARRRVSSPLALAAGGVGKGAGVQLDDLGAELARGVDLVGIGLDEKAHANAGGLQAVDGGRERLALAGGIEAAFGGDFRAVLGNEADFLGQDAQRDLEDLGRVAHLEIELRIDALAQAEDVAILDVPAIGAQMDGDAAARRRARRRRRRRRGRARQLGESSEPA